jgi:microcystin-dependent protein
MMLPGHAQLPAMMRYGFGDMPVGSVTAFAGNLGAPQPGGASPPDSSPPTGSNVTNPIEAWGWMLCDGRALATQLYPELFAALGYQYGGSDSIFNIPDYRGYFLRGVDDGSGNDPDVTLRTLPPGGTGTITQAGSIQSDAMLVHKHDYQIAPAPASTQGDGSAATVAAQTTPTSDPVSESDVLLTTTTGISQYETRPKNIYVNYLIKFTYRLRRAI